MQCASAEKNVVISFHMHHLLQHIIKCTAYREGCQHHCNCKKKSRKQFPVPEFFFQLFSLIDQYFTLHRDIVNDKTSAKQA